MKTKTIRVGSMAVCDITPHDVEGCCGKGCEHLRPLRGGDPDLCKLFEVILGRTRLDATTITTPLRCPDCIDAPSPDRVRLNSRLRFGDDFATVIKVLDEPNSGLVVLRVRGYEFSLPADLLNAGLDGTLAIDDPSPFAEPLILDRLRDRIKHGVDGDHVVVTDDEFAELLDALDGFKSCVDQGDGKGGRPVVVFGRKVVALDGSQRESRDPR